MIKCSHLTPKSIYSYIDDLIIANCLIDARIVCACVRTPIPSRIDLADNTSYHIAASRTVSHECHLTMARDCLRLLAHVYDSVASIHMTENPGRHG